MPGARPSIEPGRAFWISASAIAAVLAGTASLCVRLPEAPARAARSHGIGISHARLDGDARDRVLREEAQLRDPTPLFLPTEWSSAAALRPGSAVREPGETWGGYPAWFAFAPDESQVDMPLPDPAPASPVEALRAERWDMPFLGWGQKDGVVPPLDPRGAFVEVVSADDGRMLLAGDLPAAPASGQDWAPIQWMAAVEPAGPAGAPVLLRSSGIESVDRFFADYLEKTWRLGDRLSRLGPGFYRITLGP